MAALRRLYGDWNGALTSGGSSNAYTLSPNRTIAAYAAGINFTFLANHANTGAATLNVSSLGAKDIRDRNGVALTGAEIASGGVVEVVYDNSNGYFRATNLVANSASSNPSASETVQGIVELATAAEILAGASTSLAMTPGRFAGNKSIAANGYYKFPGGFIVQWFSVTCAPSTTTSENYAVAYTTVSIPMVVMYENSTTTRSTIKVYSHNTSSVTLHNPNAASVDALVIGVGF